MFRECACCSSSNCYRIRTWTAEDDCGNLISDTQTIRVQDTEVPVLAGIPANVVMECSENIPAVPVVTATDNCGDEVILQFNETTIQGDCTNRFIITRTWTAEDDCGNSAVGVQLITIEDNTELLTGPLLLYQIQMCQTLRHLLHL